MLLLNKVRMRTSRIGRATQARWGIIFADRVGENYQQLDMRGCNGRSLFSLIPKDMQEFVTGTWFDPYESQFRDRSQVHEWCWNHVIFDPEGNIIAIHDRGDVLVYAESWAVEADWFARVKSAEWLKREKRNG